MQAKICAVNSSFIHANPAVHSLACYFRELCDIDIKVCEFTVNDVYKNVLFSILADKPEVIAFSVYIWNIDMTAKLCGDIKKIAPEIKIILGGPEVSFDVSADANIYDYIIAGEGERAFFCLANEIFGNDISSYKEKFGYKTDGKKISCDEIDDLSEIPFIYSRTDINLFQDRIIYYESSRGCPFSCSYCLSARNKRVRELPLERVYSDLDFFIKEESVRQVKFADRTFNSDKNRAYAIFKYIMNHAARKINFHFEICADLLDERIINLLGKAKSGLIQLEIGIQTTNEKSLEMCARKTDIKKCFDNINLLSANKNINIHVDLIAGLPEDTPETFKEAFNQVYGLKAHQFQLGFLKLLKGAPLNNQVEQYGYKFSANPPYEILACDNMHHEDLAVLGGVETALNKFYNSGKFTETLDYLCGYFKTPYDFYLELSGCMMRNNRLYRAASLDNLYKIIIDFALDNQIDINDLKEMLLLDYHSGDIYDNPPKAVRDIWTPYKSYKDTPEARHTDTARKIGSRYYYFDYSGKNPVTGRYDYNISTIR